MTLTRWRRAMVCSASLVFLLSGTLPAAAAADPPDDQGQGPGWLGATEEVYRDTFEEAGDWWDLGEDETGRTALQDGRLFMSILGPDGHYWDAWVAPTPAAVMRVEALVEIDDQPGTAAGVACGSALGLPRWFVAGVNNADMWWLGRLIDGRLQVVERGPLMLPIAPSEGPVTIAIECAVVPSEGGDRIVISVDDRPVMTSSRLDIPVGPFDKAGLFVGTDDDEGNATFDDMTVHSGEVFALRPVDRDPSVPSE